MLRPFDIFYLNAICIISYLILVHLKANDLYMSKHVCSKFFRFLSTTLNQMTVLYRKVASRAEWIARVVQKCYAYDTESDYVYRTTWLKGDIMLKSISSRLMKWEADRNVLRRQPCDASTVWIGCACCVRSWYQCLTLHASMVNLFIQVLKCRSRESNSTTNFLIVFAPQHSRIVLGKIQEIGILRISTLSRI